MRIEMGYSTAHATKRVLQKEFDRLSKKPTPKRPSNRTIFAMEYELVAKALNDVKLALEAEDAERLEQLKRKP